MTDGDWRFYPNVRGDETEPTQPAPNGTMRSVSGRMSVATGTPPFLQRALQRSFTKKIE